MNSAWKHIELFILILNDWNLLKVPQLQEKLTGSASFHFILWNHTHIQFLLQYFDFYKIFKTVAWCSFISILVKQQEILQQIAENVLYGICKLLWKLTLKCFSSCAVAALGKLNHGADVGMNHLRSSGFQADANIFGPSLVGFCALICWLLWSDSVYLIPRGSGEADLCTEDTESELFTYSRGSLIKQSERN